MLGMNGTQVSILENPHNTLLLSHAGPPILLPGCIDPSTAPGRFHVPISMIYKPLHACALFILCIKS